MARAVPVYDYWEWQNPVKDIANAPPVSPSVGDRYIVGVTPSGAFVGHANDIATYTSGGWEFFDAVEGMTAWVDDENKLYCWSGSAWAVAQGTTGPTGSAGPTGPTGATGAPSSAQYVIMENEATLSAERRLQPGYCMVMVDGGANSDVYLAPNPLFGTDPHVIAQFAGARSLAQGWVLQGAGSYSGDTGENDSLGFNVILTTGAVSGNSAYIISSIWSMTAVEVEPKFFCRFRTGSTDTSVNYWVGFASSSPGSGSSHTDDAICFRYAAAVDGNWYAYCRNDDTGNETATSTGVAATADTEFFLRIEVLSGVAYFYIDEALVATISTNLPGDASGLGWEIYVYTKTGAARHCHFRQISWSHVYLSNDDGDAI